MNSTISHKPISHKQRLAAALSAAFVFATLCGCSRPVVSTSDPPKREVWRFAIEELEGSVQHEYALRFKELVEAHSDGEVEVVIYPYGTLGTSTHMTEQLNMGVIEFAMASPGSLGKFIPELQVFLLHFVLSEDDRKNQQILSDPEIIADFDKLYEPKGLKLLSIYSEGEMVWTTKKEIRTPADFRGVKMRVMTSPILLAAYNTYGASATPMPYSEVYSGLQLNMIDGQVNPVFAIERQKFYEVTSWMIFPGHAPFITTCAANRPFFDGMSARHRRIVEESIAELDEYIFDVQTRFQTERLKKILEEKKSQQAELNVIGDLGRLIESLSPRERTELIDDNPFLTIHPPLSFNERSRFREASQPVRDVFLRTSGAGGKAALNRLVRAAAAAQAIDD